MERFSRRHGHRPAPAPVTVRHDAPAGLREVVSQIADEAGMPANAIREVVCRVLRVRPDSNNWSDEPVTAEVDGHLWNCDWFYVYDAIELLGGWLRERQGTGEGNADYDAFEREMNLYFEKEGIGWALRDGELQVRGDEPFEAALTAAAASLRRGGRSTAAGEIGEALRDLSRRPEPDVTGSMQHALAAVECLMRDVTGDPSRTLGALLKQHPGVLPAPLDIALEKLWGFASERGRHLREGREPAFEEAALSVHIAAATCSYLTAKLPRR